MLQKRIKHNEAKLRRGEWAQREDRGEFLFGKTVGLVGLGRVGSHVARRLVNWDVRLLASDPYVSEARAAAARRHAGGPADAARRVRRRVAARLADRRDARADRREGSSGRMKPTALLVNTARGEMADEEAVARALAEGWIAGAALDAFVTEPLPRREPAARRRPRAPHPHAAQREPQRGGPPRQSPARPRADPRRGPRRGARPLRQPRGDPALEDQAMSQATYPVLDADGHVTESYRAGREVSRRALSPAAAHLPASTPPDGWDRRLARQVRRLARAPPRTGCARSTRAAWSWRCSIPTLGLFMSFLKDREWAVGSAAPTTRSCTRSSSR